MDSLWTKLPPWSQRRAARWLERRPGQVGNTGPIISFTFDDFPRSALYQGGTILRERGFIGTYYASFGLMGQTVPTGEIFSEKDLPEFARQGHELGCHTFDHYDSWSTAPAEFEASILRNQQRLTQLLPDTCFRSLSYPISWPRPQTKRRQAKYFACARGGGQTFNAGIVDLNYLKAFFIEQTRGDFAPIQQVIEDNRRANGWLIFATHDVCDSPTRFGCTPGFFARVVACAAESGAAILPVSQALHRALPAPARHLEPQLSKLMALTNVPGGREAALRRLHPSGRKEHRANSVFPSPDNARRRDSAARLSLPGWFVNGLISQLSCSQP